MLQELTQNKYYILIAIVVGTFCFIVGIIKAFPIFIILGIAVLGIQLIKINSIKQEKVTGIIGEEAKDQWKR